MTCGKITTLVKFYCPGKKHPNKILIEQGLSDEFYPDQLLTKNFAKACEKMDQKLQIDFQEGYDHSYYFIASFIEKHIRFHESFLK